MLLGIISNIPIWVWPLFLLLLFFGLRATKERQSPIWPLYLLPLLGLLALNTASRLDGAILVWGVFPIAYIAGVLIGYSKQKGWLLSRQGSRITLAGEWMTLVTMMIVFWMNFFAGFLKAVAPELSESNMFILVFVVLTACASGIFLGRGWYVLRN